MATRARPSGCCAPEAVAPLAPGEVRRVATIAKALAALEAELATAEAQLARHPFLAGPNLTLADIQFGHVLFRYFDIDIPRPALPNVTDYHNRLTQRPAYQKAVMLSYDDLRDTL